MEQSAKPWGRSEFEQSSQEGLDAEVVDRAAEEDRDDFAVREPLAIEADGTVKVPDRPGFGFALDEERIARHTMVTMG